MTLFKYILFLCLIFLINAEKPNNVLRGMKKKSRRLGLVDDITDSASDLLGDAGDEVGELGEKALNYLSDEAETVSDDALDGLEDIWNNEKKHVTGYIKDKLKQIGHDLEKEIDKNLDDWFNI